MKENVTNTPSTAPQRRWPDWAMGLLLMAATVAAYWPALHGGFIWDDNAHISENWTLRTLGGLWSIWFKPGATCQYYPLSFTAFWAGYHLWGLNPLGYHLVNVLLHGGAAVLLWQVLKRLRVRGAWLAGALFALHPVCVMSVAWMTELKNTLSAVLTLGAVWAYLRFAGLGVYGGGGGEAGGATGRRPAWRYYVLCLGLFQLAMFAKTAVSFLPVTLLLVVWWQREKMSWRDVWPLLPMLGIVLAMGQVTFAVERHTGAQGAEFNLGLLQRVLISGRSFCFYLGKLLIPYRLTFIYERWPVEVGAWRQWLYPVGTLALLGGLWGLRRRLGKGPFAALLHFYVSTSVLILLTVIYMTRYSWVADHWQYYGCMGMMALAGAGISALAGRLGRARAWLSPVPAGILLAALGAMTWRQSRMYGDIETLYRTTIAQNPDCWMAYNNLGKLMAQRGRVDEALADYRKALEIKPDNAEACYNLGSDLAARGQADAAIAQYRKALEINPDFAQAHNNLAVALAGRGRVDEALAHYQKALELKPDYAEAHNNLGNALAGRGQMEEAIAHYRKALEIEADDEPAHNNLAVALAARGQMEAAIAHYRKALEIKPDDAEAHYNLGTALADRGQSDEAIAHYRKALDINPNYAEAHNNLGNALAGRGQMEEAIAQYRQALAIKPGFADARRNLAAVLAERERILSERNHSGGGRSGATPP